jgi:DNA processing protein
MNTAERRATAALWSIQGVGPITLAEVRNRVGPVGEILEQPVASWAPQIPFRGDTLAYVMAVGSLARAADRLEKRCRAMGARILFYGDPGFPSRIDPKMPSAPALLFAFGPGTNAPPRRRLAIVGTRRISSDLLGRVVQVAGEAADFGLGIVSGAAEGVDQAAHRGALDAKGETWAFLGCGLDEIDFGQREITRRILGQGGTVFSEFPPGFRSNKNSFKIRNRLISGSSDAVLVFRAPLESGALHTATYAKKQGRPVLATPGDPWCEVAAGSNKLLQQGDARPHFDLTDLVKAVGLEGAVSTTRAVPLDPHLLTGLARQVLDQLRGGSADFEGLLNALPGPTSGELSAALVELEVFGAVVHKGGRRYEKR